MIGRAGRGGFTLPEALIALTISSVLVLLVGTVFLVQNDFYSHITLRSQVHENARAMNEIVANEIRSVAAGGVMVADSSRLVVRASMVTAAVCGASVFVLGTTRWPQGSAWSFAGLLVILALRFAAIRWRLTLPLYEHRPEVVENANAERR